MEPYVSVVVTYHNEGDLLSRALQSVAQQDYDGRVEVVVVDDASEVRPVIPTRFRFPIRLLRSERNVFSPAARNIGINTTHGEYICFLDADDVFLPEKLGVQLQFMVMNPSVGVVGSQYYVHQRGRIWLKTADVLEMCYPELVSQPCILPTSFRHDICIHYGFNSCATMFRRTALESINGFNEACRFYEEWDVLVRLSQKNRVGYVPGPVYEYLCRSTNSMTTTHSPEKYASIAKMLSVWRSCFYDLPPMHKRILRNKEQGWHLLAAQFYLENKGDPVNSLIHSARSLRCRPSVWGIRSTIRSSLHLLASPMSRKANDPSISNGLA